MAKLFESLVRSDSNFEMPAKRHLGLVVFCLKVLCVYCLLWPIELAFAPAIK